MAGVLLLAVLCGFTFMFSLDKDYNEYVVLVLTVYITCLIIYAVLVLLIIYIGSAIPKEVINSIPTLFCFLLDR